MNNYSKQREIILEVIKNNAIHPTAEEIYELAKKQDGKISKSTVYRNINILVEKGKIQKITISSGPDKYDYLHEKHHHAICEICGKVYDLFYNFEEKEIQSAIKKQKGENIIVNNITINGICENCKSKNKNKEELKNGIEG